MNTFNGMSGYTDAGTRSPDSDCRCWWCWLPVKSSLHDFFACHDEMMRPRRERAERRRQAKERREQCKGESPQPTLFGDGP